jgi:hypothetical protein
MIIGARKHLYEMERAVNQTSFGLGYYRRIASLEPRTGEGILCHECRSFISLGESFAKKSSRGKPYHISYARELHLI